MATEYQGQCFLKTHAIFMKRNAIRISCLRLCASVCVLGNRPHLSGVFTCQRNMAVVHCLQVSTKSAV